MSNRVAKSCLRTYASSCSQSARTPTLPLSIPQPRQTFITAIQPCCRQTVVPAASCTVSSRNFSHCFRYRTSHIPRRDGKPSEASAPSPTSQPLHYHLFPETFPDGPPPKGHFAVDQRELRREFLRLQAKAHPDLHPVDHKERAQATSATINEAYKTLSNPLLRAQYLLSLHGIDLATDEAARVSDPDLLMDIMDVHEQLEAAETEEEIDRLREANDERLAESEAALESTFAKGDLHQATQEAIKLRYWVNIQKGLNDWEAGKPVVVQH